VVLEQDAAEVDHVGVDAAHELAGLEVGEDEVVFEGAGCGGVAEGVIGVLVALDGCLRPDAQVVRVADTVYCIGPEKVIVLLLDARRNEQGVYCGDFVGQELAVDAGSDQGG
jgi:hypothetical protein